MAILRSTLMGLTLSAAVVGLAAAADIDNPAGKAPPGLNGTAPGLQRHDMDRDNDRDLRGQRTNTNFQRMDRDHDRDFRGRTNTNFNGEGPLKAQDRDHDRDRDFRGRTNTNFNGQSPVKTQQDHDHDRDDMTKPTTTVPPVQR